MKMISPGYRLIEEKSQTKKIEQIARVCYKSEDKICEGSDFAMIKNLVKRKHFAMLEHADVCLEVNSEVYYFMNTMIHVIKEHVREEKEAQRSYLRFSTYLEKEEDEVYNPCHYLISGNIRAWIEAFEKLENMVALIPEVCQAVVEASGGPTGVLYQYVGYNQPVDACYNFDSDKVKVRVITDYSELTYNERMLHETFTVLFTCDRGITHELVRMREASFAQESTRYCNYSIDKHGNGISVITPFYFLGNIEAYKVWLQAMTAAEEAYLQLTEKLGISAQQARAVLPHSTKVDIAMTANLMEWKHIFELRACDNTGPCHPQMTEIMRPLFRDMREKYRFAFGDLYTPDEVKS